MFRKISLALLTCFALSLTPASAYVIAQHQPSHPATSEPVTVSARATGDIAELSLAYERYQLSTDAQGKHIQTLVEPETRIETCSSPPGFSLEQCSHQIQAGFPDSSLVRLIARATYRDGKKQTNSYSFAAGTYPWPDDPIPIRVTGETKSRLDIVFIPDTDIGLPNFRRELHNVIRMYFSKYPVYSANETTNYNNMYNYWYSSKFGNYKGGCSFSDPPNMVKLRAVGNAIAVLHVTDQRDCSSGGRFSSEIDYDKTLVHESGHALFGLQDEYCCDSSYREQPEVPNIWTSLQRCQADASNLSYPPNFCTQICKGGRCISFWRIDPVRPPPGSIMGPAEHSDPTSNHLNAGLRRIHWKLERCLGGSCGGKGSGGTSPGGQRQEAGKVSETAGTDPSDLSERINALGDSKPAGPALGGSIPNIEPDDKILGVELTVTDNSARIGSIQVTRAALPEDDGETELRVEALGAGDRVLHTYQVSDPRDAEIEGGEHIRLPEAKVWVFAPLNSEIQGLQLSAGETAPELPGGGVAPPIRVDLRPALQGLCGQFPSVDQCFQGIEPQ